MLVLLLVTAEAHEDTVRVGGALCVFSMSCGRLSVGVVIADHISQALLVQMI